MSLNLEFKFDDNTYRHYLNGFLTVLHCHHYLCLTTKAAIQFEDIGGIDILTDTVIDTISPVLKDYIDNNNVETVQEKIDVGVEFYSVMGLGKMQVNITRKGGQVELLRSHIDRGWIKKWGVTKDNINFFTVGYITAMFSVATGLLPESFKVEEISSIVSGEKTSNYIVEKR